MDEDLNSSGTGVQFDEEQSWHGSSTYEQNKTPKLISWVMNHSGGLIKDENQAGYVLMGTAVVVIIVSLFLVLSTGSNKPANGPVPAGQFVP